MEEIDLTRARELADAHWGYVSDVLVNHEKEQQVIDAVEFHYKSAFIHGYKHAVEDSDN